MFSSVLVTPGEKIGLFGHATSTPRFHTTRTRLISATTQNATQRATHSDLKVVATTSFHRNTRFDGFSQEVVPVFSSVGVRNIRVDILMIQVTTMRERRTPRT
jgi:hypothetical protein